MYSVMAPAVVIRPILLISVNQRAPSGPDAIACGKLAAVGRTYSVMLPAVVTRPILLPVDSVNQSAPSGPGTIANGLLPGVGIGYSVMAGCAEQIVQRKLNSPIIARPLRPRNRHNIA